MKKVFSVFALFVVIAFAVSSCGEDDSSSPTPADKLAGSFNVVDTAYQKNVSGTILNTIITSYTATVSKVNDTTISITSNRTQPLYSIDGYNLRVDWDNKTIVFSSTNGVITDENNFHLEYTYGANPYIYDVSQKYTRQ